ncbi:hypothetical protein ACFL1G_09395 [Planctomycetota bacterium]
MSAERQKATVAAVTPKDNLPDKSYGNCPGKSRRVEKISEHRKQIPRIHQANYDKAISGKSKAAALKAFCLECVCWQKEEVRLCTSPQCSLFPYRPYRISKKVSEEANFNTESTNAEDKGKG